MSSLIILSADELEIIEYLKTWNGKYVSMLEICRRAGGRAKYKESPKWAQPLLSRLVEAKLVQVNDRGHYRIPGDAKSGGQAPAKHHSPYFKKAHPANAKPVVIGEDFFPSAETSSTTSDDTSFWVTPEMVQRLKEEKAKRDRQKG